MIIYIYIYNLGFSFCYVFVIFNAEMQLGFSHFQACLRFRLWIAYPLMVFEMGS
jgi:hypothetical protein